MLLTDNQTDRQTDRQIPGKNNLSAIAVQCSAIEPRHKDNQKQCVYVQ